MITVYKYHAPIFDQLTLELPLGAEILCVQMQGGQPYVWARVDSTLPKTTYAFAWRGTGHECEGLKGYVGTVQMHGGSLVFHLFKS